MRLGPYCGGLLAGLSELCLRGASLELATPAVFEDMAGLRRLDLEACTAARTGSWLSRMLGSAADVVCAPPGLQQLRAMGSNVLDKVALELGGTTGLTRMELSSAAQLPATLKHAPRGVALGLHVAEEGHVVTRQGRDAVSVRACLADRMADIRRLSGTGLGRCALGVLGQMVELRRLCLLAGDRRRLELELALPELETVRLEGYQIIQVRGCVVWQVPAGQHGWARQRQLGPRTPPDIALPALPALPPQLRLPVCLKLHTAVLSGHGVCSQLALPPSLRVLVLDRVMREPRLLNLASMVPRLRTAVLGMGLLPASLPPSVEQLAVVGEPSEAALAQAYTGLAALLPQLPRLRQLRVTSGEALPDAVAALLPPGCAFSTAGMPREGATTDCWGRSLHQTAPVRACACAWRGTTYVRHGLEGGVCLGASNLPHLTLLSSPTPTPARSCTWTGARAC